MDGQDPGGGSVALGELINAHGAALFVDFQREYGIDLFEIIESWIHEESPKVSPLKVYLLTEGLPMKSRLAASILGEDDAAGWGRLEHILADVWDVLAATAMAGSKKKPPVYPRPGSKKDRSTTISMADLVRAQFPVGGGA